MINNQTRNIPILSNKEPNKQDEIRTNHLGKTDREINGNLISGLVKKSNRILLSISTHKFPFDFFPNTINVEEGRVTVIIRTFFLSSQVHSVDIKDISNVFINTAPFFAELVIFSKTFQVNEVRIRHLRKKEAVFTRRIIEGLRSFNEKRIDTSQFSKEELISELEKLSTTKIVT